MGTNEESIEDDPNVFVFKTKRVFVDSHFDLTSKNLELIHEVEIIFTISEEDNCTYYIYTESKDYPESSSVIPSEIFREMPKTADLRLFDKIGNLIFEFNPTNAIPDEDGDKKIHRGKISNRHGNSSSSTQSKLERTAEINTTLTYELNSEFITK
jgi:hypothetical protein